MFMVRRETRIARLDEDKVMDLFFYLILVGILGSRILYFINSASLRSDPLKFFRVWEGGLVFQGGVIACFFFTIWYCRRYKLSFLRVADVLVPGLSIGHVIGRIGCFFADCCYGDFCPRDFPLGIVFPHTKHSIAPPGIPLYPTQLFEAGGELLIFALLLTYRRRKPFHGAVFLLYFIFYSILRSVVEIYRGDQVRGFIIEGYLSVAQFISLIMIGGAVTLWFYLKKNQAVRD
jgi:phosphatidylglycerol:prolipoprotein diacylglycerol transferase